MTLLVQAQVKEILEVIQMVRPVEEEVELVQLVVMVDHQEQVLVVQELLLQ